MEAEKLKDLLKTKFSNETICWYPSAGDDIENISIWKKNLGNNLSPKLFIYTDCGYMFIEDRLYYNGLDKNHEIGKLVEECGFSFQNFYDERGVEYPDFMNKELEEYNDGRLKKIIRKRLKEKVICQNGSVMSKEDKNYFLTLQKKGLMDAKDIMKIMNFVPEIEATHRAVLFKNDSSTEYLLLISVTNASFYTFCINEGIKMDCAMIRRPMDNFISGIDFLKSIGVDEVMSDRLFTSENTTAVDSFIWKTRTYSFGDEADKAYFIKL